ncbi:MAG: class 1 fructose-bisphosphatase [Hyphomicrobiaceae bacterium]|nr:class 1 fructose-bisphosphatase [Hyphomicrobiaceae bacterium]
MADRPDLIAHLSGWSGRDAAKKEVAEAIAATTAAMAELAGCLDRGELLGLGPDGLTRRAEDQLSAALSSAPVAAVLVVESEAATVLNADRPLLVAISPLDGATNIDTNASVGSIFSILPRPLDATDGTGNAMADEPRRTDLSAAFLQPGSAQLASGFLVYGPSTVLALTLGKGTGTALFTLDRGTRRFMLTTPRVAIPPKAQEYAINASNYRHWDEAVRMYVDDCLKGAEGVRGCDFNMRWLGSLVTEIHRIFRRGGIYLYPADQREGYAHGRLRMLCEANPIALVVEEAGGAASDGRERLLDLVPRHLAQRSPVVAGSKAEVAYVERLYRHPQALADRSPLFGRRGLFRV